MNRPESLTLPPPKSGRHFHLWATALPLEFFLSEMKN